jgi:hypothetical protein
MQFSNVIVFKNHIKSEVIKFTNPVPVTHNFDNNRVIGSAELRHDPETGITYANITIDETEKFDVPFAWPAVGGNFDDESEVKKFEIKNVSLCSNRNVDDSIDPIKVGELPKAKKVKKARAK